MPSSLQGLTRAESRVPRQGPRVAGSQRANSARLMISLAGVSMDRALEVAHAAVAARQAPAVRLGALGCHLLYRRDLLAGRGPR